MNFWDLDRMPRLLIVEDDIDVSNMLRIYFQGQGMEVDVVAKGAEALSSCLAKEYDLVSLDVMLPDMNGYEVIQLLKKLDRFIPVIFLTQRDERSDRIMGLELGADDYITKPFDIEEYKLRVRNAIKRRAEYLKYLATSAGRTSKDVRILFLTANPKDTDPLRLDQEYREIDQAILQAEYRDKFDLRQQWAVRIEDIQGHLLRYKPNIVHFSGHGTTKSEILLEDNLGNSHPVKPDALSRLFSVLKGEIRGVVLSACYSERQAQAIKEHVDFVIGMSKAIGDQSAIVFARAFYQAIAYGKDVRTAFNLGCIQIDLESLSDEDIPKLLITGEKYSYIYLVK